MISLSVYRQDIEAMDQFFFRYIEQLKETNLVNVAHHPVHSAEYLSVLAINCIIAELQKLIDKKLVNTSGPSQKIKLSDAQAVVFYKLLLALPLPTDAFYLNKLRNDLIEQLDGQLILQNIYAQAMNKS